MIYAVIDTNVLVSALIYSTSPRVITPADFINLL